YACNSEGIKPNITFNIETLSGTVLGTYSTGDIAGNTGWLQYGIFFSTTPGESSVVLRMTNNAPGGCGNDVLLDDITFRACGPLVTADINGSLDSVDVCTGDNSIFTVKADVSSGYSDPAYQWQVSTDGGASYTNLVGDTNKIFVRPATNIPAKYFYRLAVSQRQNVGVTSCSIFSNVVVVGVNKYPIVNASASGNCTGDTLHLMANDGVLFSWKGPLGFSSNDQNPFIPNTGLGNNGTYDVSVTSAKGCTIKDSVTTSLFLRPDINAGGDKEICRGSAVQLNSTGSNFITSYQWSPPEGLSKTTIPNPVASPDETTLYVLTVTHNNCNVSDSVLVTVNENPVANAGPDKVIIKGQSTTLDGTASGTDVTYLWTPDINISGSSTLTPIANPDANQIYILNVYSNKGCKTATDSVLVKVYQQLYIPNAFTPNGDGINDTWYIEALKAYPAAEVKVYNRYGQPIFDNNGKSIWWNGTYKGEPQQPGAYVYMIDLKNGTPIIKGIVYIIL
ncbi:MAG: gliding motility-associated C-terminal domain-containing protein, partial [Ginsengibacter sp.]